MKLNREAWKKCGTCCELIFCSTCIHQFKSPVDPPCVSCYRGDHWESALHNYCPHCGRPLTKRAWDELETRIETLQKGATK